MVAANTNGLATWSRTLMGREELLADPRFESQSVRAENREAFDVLVSDWAATCNLSELLPLATRDRRVSLHDRILGELKMSGIVPKLSEALGETRWSGPASGGPHQGIYSGLLRFSSDEPAVLTACGGV